MKYTYHPDITSRATLEHNFRERFEALNGVRLTDHEIVRLLDDIIMADVFVAARTLRERNSVTRDDGTPLNYTLINIKDWCKNSFEVVIDKLKEAMAKLTTFLHTHGVEARPLAVANLKGDEARVGFIQTFKEVQRLKTQLAQYTDLTEADVNAIKPILPKEELLGFRGAYLQTAQRLREGRQTPATQQEQEAPDDLDLEIVLFASTLIDDDYIMGLMSSYLKQPAGKQQMSREQLIALIDSDAKFMDEREDIAACIATLKAGEDLITAEPNSSQL